MAECCTDLVSIFPTSPITHAVSCRADGRCCPESVKTDLLQRSADRRVDVFVVHTSQVIARNDDQMPAPQCQSWNTKRCVWMVMCSCFAPHERHVLGEHVPDVLNTSSVVDISAGIALGDIV